MACGLQPRSPCPVEEFLEASLEKEEEIGCHPSESPKPTLAPKFRGKKRLKMILRSFVVQLYGEGRV